MLATIKNIESGSPASKTKIKAGDTLLSINGHNITDVLDYKYYSYDCLLHLELKNESGKIYKVKIKKPEGLDPGLEFETYLMDKARSCANNCVFCFVDQMPKGMRETLYFKDDDARLSFLMGNYITMTNLSQREVQRIIDLRVSPLNISVHATDPELRAKLLGNKNGAKIMDLMRRFAQADITMNCQIVCCPELNDGEELKRSMRDLAELYPQVNSVSIVPVGLTKYREGLYPLKSFDRETARQVIDIVEKFGDKCLKDYGSRVFFCSDEFYLKAELKLPPDEFYGEYSQLENGVGMLRLFETEFNAMLGMLDKASEKPFSIATGVAAAPFLDRLLQAAKKKCPVINGTVFGIKNDFFGHTIDVAGLVTGEDLIAQLRDRNIGERLLIPQNMLRHGEGVFLDDITVEDVERELGIKLVIVSQDGADFAEKIFNEEEA